MGDSIRLVRGTAYGDAKSSCAPGFSGARRSAAAPDLITEMLPVLQTHYVEKPPVTAGFLSQIHDYVELWFFRDVNE